MSAPATAVIVGIGGAMLALGLLNGLGFVALVGAGPGQHGGPPPPMIHAQSLAYRTWGAHGSIWENGTTLGMGNPLKVVFTVGGVAQTVLVNWQACNGAVGCYSAVLTYTFQVGVPTQVSATVSGTGQLPHPTVVSTSVPAVTVTAVSNGGGGPPPSSTGPAQVLAAFNWATRNLTLTAFDQSTVYNASVTSIVWSFGDGATGAGSNVTHTYSRSGAYNVTETVTARGASGSAAGSVNQTVVAGTGNSTQGCSSGSCLPTPLFALTGTDLALILGPVAMFVSFLTPYGRTMMPTVPAVVLVLVTLGSYATLHSLWGT